MDDKVKILARLAQGIPGEGKTRPRRRSTQLSGLLQAADALEGNPRPVSSSCAEDRQGNQSGPGSPARSNGLHGGCFRTEEGNAVSPARQIRKPDVMTKVGHSQKPFRLTGCNPCRFRNLCLLDKRVQRFDRRFPALYRDEKAD
jgi:hypothetical protein